jgi:hypothetical protein
MKTLFQARILRVAGLAAGAVAVGVAAIAVTASASGMSFGFNRTSNNSPVQSAGTSLDATSSSALCSTFMQHFQNDLGKSQSQITSAFQKAIGETLADEVKAGQITQSQADTIKAKLANQTPCTLPALRAPGANKPAIGAYMQQYLAASASALGISQTQLTTDLKSGQSLSQVASAQHVSEADFRTKVIANLKPALDQAVTDKKITSAQEQTIISRLQTGPLPLWNLPAHKPRATAPTAPASPSAA